MPKIAVIGAGVVGLSTAVCLQENVSGARVTVFADKFGSETVSDGAPALFRPNYIAFPNNDRILLRKWSEDSFNHFHKHAVSAEANETGISLISGYLFYNDERKDELYRHVSYSQRFVTDRERQLLQDNYYKYGEALSTLLIECRRYLPWLTRRFRLQGGMIEAKTIECFRELTGYDVVVNCSGLGSKKLVPDDKELTSQRGQLMRVKAPWLTGFLYAGNAAIIAGQDDVVIASTMQMDDYNSEVDPRDAEELWQRACRIIPSLKSAIKLYDWVGLRPYRKSVRVETEIMKFDEQTLPVVHNYGHGSVGVTLSWGTAEYATKLVHDLLHRQAAAKL